MSVEFKLQLFIDQFNELNNKFTEEITKNNFNNLRMLLGIQNDISKIIELGKQDLECNKKIRQLCRERKKLIKDNIIKPTNKDLDDICNSAIPNDYS